VARPRKSASTHVFSAGQAKYVLERLIGDRRISSADVKGYVADMQREIGELEHRLQSLKDAAGDAIRGAMDAIIPARRRRGRPSKAAAKQAVASAGAAVATKAKRAKAKITPEQLASRKLQGRYLGLIRQIPASRRAQYQKTAKERGREAAIRDMQTALNK
jgi:hypothetical protein